MSYLLIAVFLLGYIFIVFEHKIHVDKAATALITGMLCWVVYLFFNPDFAIVNQQLHGHIGDIASILFFLIGAMTIVELIDLHQGFQIIADKITTTNKRTFLFIITILSFFLSAVLDNLTTAIVMASLVQKIVSDKKDRMVIISMVIIAANAGGAWSPIGDVTTTMLWIGNQISVLGVITTLFIPCLVSVLVPMLLLMRKVTGDFIPKGNENMVLESSNNERKLILFLGVGLLLFVPFFKAITHLPPYMGMMLAVGILWVISEFMHKKSNQPTDRSSSIFFALEKIDMPSILFFMGILLSVAALEASGFLAQCSQFLAQHIKQDSVILTCFGLSSSVFDNVPLVASLQGMYTLAQYPTGHFFWNYLAFCTGTGGSILIIGSAAGIAAMGIEKISFVWYLKNISLATLIGFLVGAMVCLFLH